jgi:uncharacterized protein YdeI (YjbR/CyaY-like superfamily)
MGKKDPRVDAYIAKSAEFARPILEHLRAVVHETCPQVEEDMKWSMPHFMYEGMLCGMAAFKQHCSFGFWKGSLVVGAQGQKDAMGQFGCITSVKDLPSKKVLAGYIRQAMKLNEEKVPSPSRAKKKTTARAEPGVPPELERALGKSRRARETFEAFSPSHRREYIQWITEAKREETRERRVETTIEWLEEGKPRNWKYVRA